ncbi:uncharacterized protein BN706_00611 [Clostridium sp. CAG:557]|nr:uncharacterized protein BN706_00611 [Clostridium sp. CAG:557]
MKKSNEILSQLKTRKFKVGSLATALTVVVTAIIIVINLIVGQLTDKFSLSLDLTQNKIFSLTEQSINFIKNLDKDVEIILLSDENTFTQTNSYFAQANSVLRKYDLNSNKIKLTYVDTVKNPTYLNEYQDENLTETSIIVKSGDKHKIITVQDIFDIQRSYYGSTITGSKAEQELTSAILYVTSENQTKIAILKGYGEQDSAAFQELLKKNNFNIVEVSLLTQDIPEDVKLAMIYGPERDFDIQSVEKLEKFMAIGGKNLVYALNPNQAEAPNLNAFLEKHGIKVNPGLVYETNMQNVVSNAFEAVNDYVDEEYKSDLKNADIPVLMPYCKPLEATNSENTKVLLQFSLTAGILPKGAAQDFDFAGNVSGPIPSVIISVLKTDTEKDSNLAVIGSYGALMQDYLSSNALNNSAYFVNMINKLTAREDVGITIESKSIGGKELGANKATADTIGVAMAIILPIGILILGIVVFLKRKNK